MFIPQARLLNYAMLKFIPKILFLCTLLLAGCYTSNSVVIGDTTSLAGLQAMSNTRTARSPSRQSMGRIREMALKETALSLGAQAALAWRANLIDADLTRQARNLDTIYDFNALLLEHNVLPPVLLEGRNLLNLADEQNIRISDRTYKVAKQARFVTTPPNWRQYLWMDYKAPEYPHLTLLPQNRDERNVWCVAINQGWQNGIEQASTILEESIARIKEDYSGMILYRKLLAMNMVSPPFVSHTSLGVTGDASEIHIDDKVLRITALPALNVNSNEWIAAVAPDENVLSRFKNMEKLAKNTHITITDKSWQPVIAPVN